MRTGAVVPGDRCVPLPLRPRASRARSVDSTMTRDGRLPARAEPCAHRTAWARPARRTISGAPRAATVPSPASRLDLTAFKGAGQGPYLVAGVGGGMGSSASHDFSSLGVLVRGGGYQLLPASFLSFAAEARWRELSLDSRDGLELAAGLSIRFGGRGGGSPQPAATPVAELPPPTEAPPSDRPLPAEGRDADRLRRGRRRHRDGRDGPAHTSGAARGRTAEGSTAPASSSTPTGSTASACRASARDQAREGRPIARNTDPRSGPATCSPSRTPAGR